MIKSADIETIEDVKNYCLQQETMIHSIMGKIVDGSDLNEDEQFVFSSALVDMMDRILKMNKEVEKEFNVSELYVDTALCIIEKYHEDIKAIIETLENMDENVIIEFSEEEYDLGADYEEEEEDEEVYPIHGILH